MATKKKEIVQALSIAIKYSLCSDVRRDELEASAAINEHAAEVKAALGKMDKSVVVDGMRPDFEKDGSIRAIVTLRPAEGNQSDMYGGMLTDRANAFLDDLLLVSVCVMTGDAASRMLDEVGAVKMIESIKPQEEIALLDDDGNVVVTRNPHPYFKRLKPVLMAAAELDRLGIDVAIEVCGTARKIPAVTSAALKPEWRAIQEKRHEAGVTGYFKAKRTAEMTIDSKSYELPIPHEGAEMLHLAAKDDAFIRVEIEYSKPSNPCIPGEEKLRVITVLGLVAVQEKLALEVA